MHGNAPVSKVTTAERVAVPRPAPQPPVVMLQHRLPHLPWTCCSCLLLWKSQTRQHSVSQTSAQPEASLFACPCLVDLARQAREQSCRQVRRQYQLCCDLCFPCLSCGRRLVVRQKIFLCSGSLIDITKLSGAVHAEVQWGVAQGPASCQMRTWQTHLQVPAVAASDTMLPPYSYRYFRHLSGPKHPYTRCFSQSGGRQLCALGGNRDAFGCMACVQGGF